MQKSLRSKRLRLQYLPFSWQRSFRLEVAAQPLAGNPTLPPLRRKRLLCRVLLCFLLGAAFTCRQSLGTDKCAHEKYLVVVGTALAHDLVGRCDALLFLCKLLQFALGVLPEPACNDRIRFVEELVCDEFLCRLVAGVEVQSADECLKCVRKNYHPRATGIFGLPSREEQIFVYSEFRSRIRDALRIHERGAKSGQLPFRFVGILGIQKFGDRKLEYRIAQELEALVVLAAGSLVLVEI